jgi:hypothetical protein
MDTNGRYRYLRENSNFKEKYTIQVSNYAAYRYISLA